MANFLKQISLKHLSKDSGVINVMFWLYLLFSLQNGLYTYYFVKQLLLKVICKI